MHQATATPNNAITDKKLQEKVQNKVSYVNYFHSMKCEQIKVKEKLVPMTNSRKWEAIANSEDLDDKNYYYDTQDNQCKIIVRTRCICTRSACGWVPTGKFDDKGKSEYSLISFDSENDLGDDYDTSD